MVTNLSAAESPLEVSVGLGAFVWTSDRPDGRLCSFDLSLLSKLSTCLMSSEMLRLHSASADLRLALDNVNCASTFSLTSGGY